MKSHDAMRSDLIGGLPSEIDAFANQLYTASPRPKDYLAGAVRIYELKLLLKLYIHQKPSASIEWGLGSGISAAAFAFTRRFLNLSRPHVALDPFQEECCASWGLKCLEEFKVMNQVDFHPLTSEEFLLQCRKDKRMFDFAFIDGAHDIGHKLTDAQMISDRINPGGIVCFHDSMFRSTSLAVRFLVDERGFELLDLPCESALKRRLRGIKNIPRVGLPYALHYAPKINFAVSAMIKRKAP